MVYQGPTRPSTNVKKFRKGGLFIEQNKLRLNRLGEVTEIKRAKKTRRK